MDEYIVKELRLDCVYNSNRYIFKSIKYNFKANGIIVFPMRFKGGIFYAK